MRNLVLLLAALAAPVAAQTTHTVTVRNFEFDPATLTIDVGDTVRWMNESGFHNVRQLTGAEAFGSGAASGDAWQYEFTFTQVGTSTYDCIVHPADMQGSVTVQIETSGEPRSEARRPSFEFEGANPFRGSARLALVLTEPAEVRVAVYDALGREVAVLHEGLAQAGRTPLEWTPGEGPSAVFVVRAVGEGVELSQGIARIGRLGASSHH